MERVDEETATKRQESLRPLLAELERYHGWANARFFAGTLSRRALITIASRGRRRALGWYGHARWRTSEEVARHEIVLAAEHANRAPEEILETVHHEMVHQYNAERSIRDTDASGRRHNRRFKEAAELAGLVVGARDRRVGFAFTAFRPDTRQAVEAEFKPRLDVFGLWRPGHAHVHPTAPTKLKLWRCACGYGVRVAIAEFRAHCDRCGSPFRRMDAGPSEAAV